jgi:hypothetical protein
MFTSAVFNDADGLLVSSDGLAVFGLAGERADDVGTDEVGACDASRIFHRISVATNC